jgi:hypothetical protein
MQERGVSTRVSVRFDQVNKDGSIDPNLKPVKLEMNPITPTQPAEAANVTSPATDEGDTKPKRAVRHKPAKVTKQDESTKPSQAATTEQPVGTTEGATATAVEPPVIEVVTVAPKEHVVATPSPEPVAATMPVSEPAPMPLVPAPLGLGDQPGQQTTLGMSPLKRALAKLRETVQQEQKQEKPSQQ